MSRRITPHTTLDNLKKEAKRWLKDLRAGDPEARARLVRALTNVPEDLSLRDVQRALAIEHGFPGWTPLKEAMASRPAPAPGEQIVATFLDYACPDHHVRGRPAHRIARHAATRILEQHQEITRGGIYTAVVCGEADEVARILRERPDVARSNIGPKGWEPLLYLCFTRLPLDKSTNNAVAIARMLLDHGADPNAFFMAGSSRYTPLTGVVGEGEEDRPPHPKRDELTRLLLQRGAEPYDGQVVYNIGFHGNILWYTQLMYEFSVQAGRKTDWDDPEWHMLDQGPYGTGARWHLGIALEHNNFELAEWCLSHGASPDAEPPADPRLSKRTLYEEAVRAGKTDMAVLLVRYGAKRMDVTIEGEAAFIAACLRLDREAAKRMLENHPEYLRSRELMRAAVRGDRADVVDLLLSLGLSVDVEYEQKQRPIHIAANHDAVNIAELLINRGAQIDPVELNWNNTPMDFAVWHDHPRMIALLSRYTRDLWNLAFTGNLERLREIFAAQPDLARLSYESTPLFYLPEDEKTALEIVELFLANGADPTIRRENDGLTAAQLARRRGLNEAADLLESAAAPESPEVSKYVRLANDMVTAYATGDDDAMKRINQHYGRSFTADDLRATVWRLLYKVRQARGDALAFGLAEAQELISRLAGFNNWTTLKQSVGKGVAAAIPAYAVDSKQSVLAVRRDVNDKEWDEIIEVVKDRGITTIEANGRMTDAALKRIAALDHVTDLRLDGSRQLSDDGLRHLAQMPQLRRLDLNEYPGGKLTDGGLEALRYLRNLQFFNMTWQRGISDAGVANLRFCDNLEMVNLMGTPTGDGVIEALRGKPKLRRLDTGRLVTDAGLALLPDFPLFKISSSRDAEPTHLLIDGPFTNQGLSNLAGLDGLVELDLFWHVTGITSKAFEALRYLPNLASLGCDGELSNDEAMRHIAAIPRLRKLRAQGTVATDEGFIALSRSTSLERFWGRECPNLTGRGFVALSRMPALQALGVSCQRVDDEALASLPAFPSLRDLTPIDVKDDGFRHVGKCVRLDRLACMYCRDTTDVATEHIAGLQLKTYYAGLTQITDRSLEILGRMTSLESIELYETKLITDAGIAHLARLPRLREVHLGELPNVTLAGAAVFPANVRVEYNV